MEFANTSTRFIRNSISAWVGVDLNDIVMGRGLNMYGEMDVISEVNRTINNETSLLDFSSILYNASLLNIGFSAIETYFPENESIQKATQLMQATSPLIFFAINTLNEYERSKQASYSDNFWVDIGFGASAAAIVIAEQFKRRNKIKEDVKKAGNIEFESIDIM